MAGNLTRFKTPSEGLKATNMIVLVHKLTQRVLTSRMSSGEYTCERVYLSECRSVCMCVRECFFTFFFPRSTCSASVKMDRV